MLLLMLECPPHTTGFLNMLYIFLSYVVGFGVPLIICLGLFIAIVAGFLAFVTMFNKNSFWPDNVGLIGMCLCLGCSCYWYFHWYYEMLEKPAGTNVFQHLLNQPYFCLAEPTPDFLVTTVIASLPFALTLFIPWLLRCWFVPTIVTGLIYIGIAIFGV
jgi:hypothetical protein